MHCLGIGLQVTGWVTRGFVWNDTKRHEVTFNSKLFLSLFIIQSEPERFKTLVDTFFDFAIQGVNYKVEIIHMIFNAN